MSDRSVLESMLGRAGIPFEPDEVSAEWLVERGIPAAPNSSIRVDSKTQPHEGGYSGFFTQFLFDEHGALVAVWAWE